MSVLVLTVSYDETATYLETLLKRSALPCIRFNTDEYPAKYGLQYNLDRGNSKGTLKSENTYIELSNVSCVLYRKRPLPTPSDELSEPDKKLCFRESLFFLEGVFASVPSDRWINSMWSTMAAERKVWQLHIGAYVGLRSPRTLITTSPDEAKNFLYDTSSIVKPVSFGIYPSEPRQAIFTNDIDENNVDLSLVSKCPTLFQEKIDKEYDVRVTWLDGTYVAMKIVGPENKGMPVLDWRRTYEHNEYCECRLPADVEVAASRLMSILQLRYGALDFVVGTNQQHYFLEVNPAGEWGWLEPHSGGKIGEMFIDAIKRTTTKSG